MLAQLVARAAAHVPPMGILAGAGVSDTNVDELVRATGVREVHGKNAGRVCGTACMSCVSVLDTVLIY